MEVLLGLNKNHKMEVSLKVGCLSYDVGEQLFVPIVGENERQDVNFIYLKIDVTLRGVLTKHDGTSQGD